MELLPATDKVELGLGSNALGVQCIDGPGDDSNMKMPRCVCWVSQNIPILNGTLSRITYLY